MTPRLPIVGAIVAAILASPAADAVADLSRARAARDRAVATLARPVAGPVALPDAAMAADGAADARSRLAARLRAEAIRGGVLIEAIVPDRTGPEAIAVVAIRVSGPEKSVIAFADTIERTAPMLRLSDWRLVPAPGGVRLDGRVVAPWRG